MTLITVWPQSSWNRDAGSSGLAGSFHLLWMARAPPRAKKLSSSAPSYLLTQWHIWWYMPYSLMVVRMSAVWECVTTTTTSSERPTKAAYSPEFPLRSEKSDARSSCSYPGQSLAKEKGLWTRFVSQLSTRSLPISTQYTLELPFSNFFPFFITHIVLSLPFGIQEFLFLHLSLISPAMEQRSSPSSRLLFCLDFLHLLKNLSVLWAVRLSSWVSSFLSVVSLSVETRCLIETSGRFHFKAQDADRQNK